MSARPRFTPFVRRLLLALGPCGLLAGCAIPPPDVDAAARAAAVTGVAPALEFRREGLPDDIPGAPTGTLTLAEAVRRAVTTSPEIQRDLALVQAAQAEAQLAGQAPSPLLTVIARVPSVSGGTDLEVGLSSDLLALLQRSGRAEAAGRRLEALADEAVATALDVVAATRELYAEVQTLEGLLPVLAARVELLERRLAAARARHDLGAGPRHDVVTAEAQRLQVAVDLERRRLELRQARLALARRLGEPSGAADWTLEPWSPPADPALDEATCLRVALAARPEVAALERELQARETEQRLAAGLAFDGASAGLHSVDEDELAAGPAFQVPLPLFGGGEARRLQAEALAAETRHQLAQARRAVIAQVRSALAELAGARANLGRVQDELLPAQERRRAEIEVVHRAGQVDLASLLLAEDALCEAQASRLELERAVSTASTRLQRALGGPLRLATPTAPTVVAREEP